MFQIDATRPSGQTQRTPSLSNWVPRSCCVFFTPSDKSSRVKSKKENQAASSQTTNHIYLIWGLGK